jgi:hypothetical protein
MICNEGGSFAAGRAPFCHNLNIYRFIYIYDMTCNAYFWAWTNDPPSPFLYMMQPFLLPAILCYHSLTTRFAPAAQLGRTGLIQAANTGQIEVVALLLENGANPDAADTARIPHTPSHTHSQERDDGRALTADRRGCQSASHIVMRNCGSLSREAARGRTRAGGETCESVFASKFA